MAPRRRPQPLAHALERFQGQLAPPTLLGEVQRVWAPALGHQLAEHAEPVSERDGVVTARCDSAVWAAELTMLAGSLCERLNTRIGGRRPVVAIKFTAAPRRPSR
jgi:predicted nucleic acid-binding Zn ribbon protein